MKLVRVLLFEDSKDTAELIIAELQKTASPVPLQVVWFSSRPDFEEGKEFWSDSFPLACQTNFPEIKGEGEAALRGDSTWWQGDFDGAILDVYDQKTGKRVGEEFALWLQHARFVGPVVLCSVQDLPPGQFPLLPLARCVTKSRTSPKGDGVPDWVREVSETLWAGLRFCEKNGVRNVGSRGRDPGATDSVRRYWGEAERLATREGSSPAEGWALWVGDDAAARERVLAFLNQKELPLDSLGLTEPLSPERWGASISSVFRHPLKRRPHALWIDWGRGRPMRLADTMEECRLAREKMLHPFLSIVLVCDRIRDINKDARKDLLRTGTVVVDRKMILELPGLWAEERVERFAMLFQVMRPFWSAIMDRDKCASELTTAEREQTAGYRAEELRLQELRARLQEKEERLAPVTTLTGDTFEALLNVLLIARSNSYIWGEGWRPSLAEWLGSYPLSGRDVTQSFSKYRKPLLNYLSARGAISDGVRNALISTR